jgi:hypothetical protein
MRPTVHWEDWEIADYAVSEMGGSQIWYIELRGAVSPTEPDIAIVTVVSERPFRVEVRRVKGPTME